MGEGQGGEGCGWGGTGQQCTVTVLDYQHADNSWCQCEDDWNKLPCRPTPLTTDRLLEVSA